MNPKRIVILGGGESGSGAAVLAKKEGFDVFLSDRSPITNQYKSMLDAHQISWEEGEHSMELILNADEVIKSPGIPDKAPVMKAILEEGIPVISEIEFAGRYTNAKMICITGSNGKTTTTLLTHHILTKAGLDVGLAGNVGNSLAYQVATGDHAYYVVELSSFQLDNMYDFKADIAILLNITPDHLDRYDYQMQNYVDSKMRITQNQSIEDAFIYWIGDPIIQKEITKIPPRATTYAFGIAGDDLSAHLNNGDIILNTESGDVTLNFENPALQGEHNMLNAMVASITANLLSIRKDVIREALKDFQGVEHRLERVRTLNNVLYINDSKATNVNSCWYALQSMQKPTVLILGGIDKGNDYSEIMELVETKVKTLIFLGTDNTPLHKAFGHLAIPHFDVTSMQEAVYTCHKNATAGDVVLLSPCCASFDLFKSYEDRGAQFKAFVNQLK